MDENTKTVRIEGKIDSTRDICRGSQDYPGALMKLSDPPTHLYVLGEIPTSPMVAIVGSRKADQAAKRFVFRLAGELSAHGLAVLSGGAEGVDTAAHEGALDAGGLTVAVIGSGFDYMYPQSNKDLFDRVAKQGALLSEFAPEQPPAKWTFPRRNRLVAAMASAVIVAQSGERSGALITARIARELGVALGSVPGRAGDPRNLGSHQLLRSGAAMVENAKDVLLLVERTPSHDQLGLPGIAQKKRVPSKPDNLPPDMSKILDILSSGPLHIDNITTETGFAPGEVGAALMSLEIAGLVEDEGGKNFVRVD
jgi:DNA processing protein